MKIEKKMKTNAIKLLAVVLAFASLPFLTGCKDDDPVKEDVPELITKATLTFTPTLGMPIVVSAIDPDGEGIQNIEADGPINLQANKSYTLTITLINELAEPSEPEYNVTEEVEEEADEHMFFFSWTNNTFIDPSGNGNIDNRADDVNYEDEDGNALPLGLETFWTTAAIASGNFRVVLKHQPGLKSATADSNTGETDLDITFTLDVQ